MNKYPTDLPRRIGFRGLDGAQYSFTRVTRDGVEGLQIDRTDPNDSSKTPESFFVPGSELEDLTDALMAFFNRKE